MKQEATPLIERSASYHKRPGTLKVLDNSVGWTPSQAEFPHSVSLSLLDVKSQMVSAQGSKQALLKLTTLNSSESYVFEFVRAAKPDFVSRDEIKDFISRQLAKLKASKEKSGTTEQPQKESESTKSGVSSEEAKRRLEVLRKRPELQKLHMSLVGGGLISDTHFWNGVWYRLHQSEQELLNKEQASVKQTRGISSEILSEINPVEEKGKTVKYRLTQDIIHKIFLEDPAVHLAFQSYVPAKMSEQAFWTQYFQSRYICQGKKSEKDDIFTPFEAQVQKGKVVKDKKEILKDVENEINLFLDDKAYQSGYGINEHSITKQIQEDPSLPLLQRLNRHSSLVVEASNTSNAHAYKEDLYQTLAEQHSLQKQEQLLSLPYSFLPSSQSKSIYKPHNWKYLAAHLRNAPGSLYSVKPSVDTSRKVLEELFDNM
ncbi:transcription initiation factor TFIIH subunit H1 isoform 2 [Galdieria sulphuraria]|uniref:Transcription initiation factor TFIIH subunit H1 isoform 2 n=1 Tax=Galdieria sulphuraria TaxID=130081 RepID=M2XXN2_GALSU|nr:transcription initiation factor TFIIH subunit H1 isoform 2 [Galdieria sulphuraria]EME28199.1 transcription initiation factor TFIIH subunit H1 isoform 2 [Galdieria sulphuraria]|eukprot:XP_005704719.1 transcription initiation factor TFIIH subunit H1 isoform 2 [Galdieria sulphuraria]